MKFSAEAFDHKLASECARAFSVSTGLGCTVSLAAGTLLSDYGFSCAACPLCAAAGLDPAKCVRTHIYGMTEAERFGGKYIYFCAMGLTCFVSPILGEQGSVAKITVGPFLMVDLPDYIDYDLDECLRLPPDKRAAVLSLLPRVPTASPARVGSLSLLLFMAVGFMNNVASVNRMLAEQEIDAQQGQITAYILELKRGEKLPPYPYETERALLSAIAARDRPRAQALLNELFGHILFTTGADFSRIKSRIYELLVLISRAAIEGGTEADEAQRLCHDYFESVERFDSVEALCYWLSRAMNKLMDDVFRFSDARRLGVIHKAVSYIEAHFSEKLTLSDVAREVYLSPAYFSRVFKEETGQSFSAYLNATRIERGKALLKNPALRLIDVALLSGFEDQSYFTKVFRQLTGLSPLKYRDKLKSP